MKYFRCYDNLKLVCVLSFIFCFIIKLYKRYIVSIDTLIYVALQFHTLKLKIIQLAKKFHTLILKSIQCAEKFHTILIKNLYNWLKKFIHLNLKSIQLIN